MSFSTEDLIVEVEKRPAIWDMKSPEHSDKNIRRRCWEDIGKCFAVEDCSEKEKISLNSLLQKKWKNVRDRFNRELVEKPRSGDGNRKKAPYMYTRQLQFLRDSLSFRKTTSSQSVAEVPVCGDVDPSLPSTSTDVAEETTTLPPKKRSRGNNQVEKKIIEVLERNMKERAEIAKRIEEQEMHREQDAERLFLLSLLPSLKAIHPDSLLKAKVALIQTLDQFPKINNTNEQQNNNILTPSEFAAQL